MDLMCLIETGLRESYHAFPTFLNSLLGVVGGGVLAYKYQKWDKEKEERNSVLRRVELIRESLVQSVKDIRRVTSNEKDFKSGVVQFKTRDLRFALPDDYYKDLPFELMFKYIGREHIDNIKNIARNVIPKWNNLANSANENDSEIISHLSSLAKKETLPACLKVINALNESFPEIGQTSVPGVDLAAVD